MFFHQKSSIFGLFSSQVLDDMPAPLEPVTAVPVQAVQAEQAPAQEVAWDQVTWGILQKKTDMK